MKIKTWNAEPIGTVPGATLFQLNMMRGEEGEMCLTYDYKLLEQKLTESHREFRAADATIENLQMQVEKLAAENAALKSGHLFFMYSDETGFEIHKTQDAALASAKDMIAVCREEAAQDGWPEDADTICWGLIMQKAIEMDFEKPSEQNGWIGWSEYKLTPHINTPATDAILASLRAEGVEMFALMYAEEAIKDGSYNTDWKSRASSAASEYAAQLRKGVQS